MDSIKECNMYKLGFCIYGPAVRAGAGCLSADLCAELCVIVGAGGRCSCTLLLTTAVLPAGASFCIRGPAVRFLLCLCVPWVLSLCAD